MGVCFSNENDSKEPRMARTITHSNISHVTRLQSNLKADIRTTYTFKKVIGHGHFGTVRLAYRSSDTEQRAPVAIKSIPKRNVNEGLSALRRELEILMECNHPNIINLHEVYEDEQYVHLVMEHCSGGDIYENLFFARKFNESRAAKILAKIVSAVQYLHSKNICHRDIKPDNFLFTSKSKDSEIKLIDFGLSIKFGGGGREQRTVVGTPYYVAPEVLHKRYGMECDVWSMGVLLYVLLVGYPPFDGDSHNDIFQRIVKGEFSFRDSPWELISDEAKMLISEMLVVNVNRRIKLRDILNHQWFSLQRTNQLPKVSLDVFNRLKNMKAPKKLQQEAMKVLIKKLNIDQLHELNQIFRAIDKDNSGTITVEELEAALRESGLSFASGEIRKIQSRFDYVSRGTLNYTDFLMATLDTKQVFNDVLLYDAFAHFDVDSSGAITPENLHYAFEKAGIQMESNEIQGMIREYAKDGRNITFEEFKSMVLFEDSEGFSPVKLM